MTDFSSYDLLSWKIFILEFDEAMVFKKRDSFSRFQFRCVEKAFARRD